MLSGYLSHDSYAQLNISCLEKNVNRPIHSDTQTYTVYTLLFISTIGYFYEQQYVFYHAISLW